MSEQKKRYAPSSAVWLSVGETRRVERLAADAVTDGEPRKVKWGPYPNSLQTRLRRSKWLKPSRSSVLFLILRRRLQRRTEAVGFSRINMWDLPVIDIHPCQWFFCCCCPQSVISPPSHLTPGCYPQGPLQLGLTRQPVLSPFSTAHPPKGQLNQTWILFVLVADEGHEQVQRARAGHGGVFQRPRRLPPGVRPKR